MSNNTNFYIGGEWVDPLPLPRVSVEKRCELRRCVGNRNMPNVDANHLMS
jgi:hypothetical protein